MRRSVAAFLLAPLWIPLLFGLYACFAWTPSPFLGQLDRTTLAYLAAGVGAAFGYGSVPLGVLADRLLRLGGKTSRLAYALAFSASAVIAWCVILLGMFSWQLGLGSASRELADTLIHRPQVSVVAGALGALVGTTFWSVVRPDRPASIPASSP